MAVPAWGDALATVPHKQRGASTAPVGGLPHPDLVLAGAQEALLLTAAVFLLGVL